MMIVYEITIKDEATGEIEKWVVRSKKVAECIAEEQLERENVRVTVNPRWQPRERQSVWLLRLDSCQFEKIDDDHSRKAAIKSWKAWDARGSEAVMILWPEWAPPLDEVIRSVRDVSLIADEKDGKEVTT